VRCGVSPSSWELSNPVLSVFLALVMTDLHTIMHINEASHPPRLYVLRREEKKRDLCVLYVQQE
jgi:hypothetical protein